MSDIDYVLCVRAVRDGEFVAEVGASRFLEIPEGAAMRPDQSVRAATWYRDVQAAAQWRNAEDEPRGDVLFVVHGYNNSGADVLQRHRAVKASLAALGFKGVVVSFDWPSDDNALAYLADRHRAKTSALKLVTDGIRALAARQMPGCNINIHLLCHSTGAYVVREAFDDADDATLKQQGWTVSQILFAAGDISSASLAAGNPGTASIFNHCLRLTNYSNQHDAVLDISNVKRLGVAPRVGRVGLPDNAPVAAVEVDCTDYYARLTGDDAVMRADQPGGIEGAQSHSWYFGNAVFARDMFSTIIGLEGAVMPTRQARSARAWRLVRPA